MTVLQKIKTFLIPGLDIALWIKPINGDIVLIRLYL